MDTIQDLLKKILVAIPILFLFGLIYFVAKELILLIPSSPSDSATTTQRSLGWYFFGDYLPSPNNKGLLGKAKTPSATDNVFVASNIYDSGGGDNNTTYVSYDANGKAIYTKGIQARPNPGANKTFQKELYLRNLSIYTGGHIYTGLSFTGEAKNTMFDNTGKFQMLVTDMYGRVITMAYAQASTAWSIPGWTRFNIVITSALPNKVQCQLVFLAAQGSRDGADGVHIEIPEFCN